MINTVELKLNSLPKSGTSIGNFGLTEFLLYMFNTFMVFLIYFRLYQLSKQGKLTVAAMNVNDSVTKVSPLLLRNLCYAFPLDAQIFSHLDVSNVSQGMSVELELLCRSDH